MWCSAAKCSAVGIQVARCNVFLVLSCAALVLCYAVLLLWNQMQSFTAPARDVLRVRVEAVIFLPFPSRI